MFLRRSEGFDPDSISAGREVYTVEGEKLGTVSEISGSYLHVDAPWKRDYWLSAEYIDRTNGGVYMNFPRNRLDQYKLAEPGLEPEEDPMREISRGAAIVSEEEQFEQRARMELELAQLRQQLPPEHTVATVGMPVEEELAVIEEKVGLPISDIQTGVVSPTGAIVAERAIDVETPAVAVARNAGTPLSDDVRTLDEHWSFEEQEARGGRVTVLRVALAVASLLVACLFVWRLRR